jgi:hypothetical protein
VGMRSLKNWMVVLMNKNQVKARKIVGQATSTFTKAVDEVKKANVLLEKALLKDETDLDEISAEIHVLYEKLDAVQSDKIQKKAEIIQNKELIAKLERFTK